MKQLFYLLTLTLFLLNGCATHQQARKLSFPEPVNTQNRIINLQDKKTWQLPSGIEANNLFAGARLNDFYYDDSAQVIRALILPENTPINQSPWYAFQLKAAKDTSLQIQLYYKQSQHRYWPKVSYHGNYWQALDSSRFTWGHDSTFVTLQLDLDTAWLWLAAQPLETSHHNADWCKRMSIHPAVKWVTFGESLQGRPLYALHINEGKKTKRKPIVLIFSRQHPPEVSGYRAMKYFVERILKDDELAKAFRQKYHVIVFPLINPDGVDLGHWRHNAGGIDLNRDWAVYRQPETRQVADYCVKTSKKLKAPVLVGVDFHSTQEDIYYNRDNSAPPSALPGFNHRWIQAIQERFPQDIGTEDVSPLGKPISAGWFLLQFGAEGLTFELGDEDTNDYLKEKSRIAAEEFMRLLIEHASK